MITAIIVDDEEKIRKGLITLINRQDIAIEVVAEVDSVLGAVKAIEKHQPQLLFLDIELSDGESFEILNRLSTINFEVVFITAYKEYAIKAFKYSAIDYLLKPIIPSELDAAIKRVQNHINAKQNQKIEIEALQTNIKTLKKIVLKTSKKYYLIDVEKIIRCQADKSYTTFYIEDSQPIVVSKPLKEYEELLPKDFFLRIHQSHLINKNKITGYNKDGFLELENSSPVPVSSRKKDWVLSTIFK